ncbi:MAG: phosphoribosylglycinamide formyltransferase [Rickettsiales bacterium]
MGNSRRTAVLISGTGTNLQALIDACDTPDYPAEITCVISNNADAFGLQRAEKLGIATEIIPTKAYKTREAYDAALQSTLEAYKIDLVCLAGFMRILTPDFVNRWYGRMLNIHPSLLPAYRGLHTHRQVLKDGIQITGCTVHFVTPELDAGPAIIQAAVAVCPTDTEDTLAARVLDAEHQCYPQALKWVAEGWITLREDGSILHRHALSDEHPTLINPPLD